MSSHPQERAVVRLLRQQAALANFGSYAFREPVLLNILNEAARVCAEGLGVPFCKVCRYREAENDLLVDAGFGWHEGVVGRVVSRADETSPQGRAYVTGKPVIMQNLHEANDVLLPEFYGEHGIVSTLDVIIKGTDGEPYGVLEIDSPTQHTYDVHDVHFLTGFANVLAEAVATANRSEILRQTVEKMERLIVEQEKLLDERAMLAEELKHRVRNNLHLVHGMLILHQKNQVGDEAKGSVSAIIRRVMTLAEVYEQLLGSGLGRIVDLGQYLNALCSSLPGMQRDPASGIELTCEAESLLSDLDTVTALGMVVAELVSNSYEHARASKINVSLRRFETSDEAILVVSDDGVGFVEEPGSKRHGVGLVRRLAQQVQGNVAVHSDGNTVWTIRFPVASSTALTPESA